MKQPFQLICIWDSKKNSLGSVMFFTCYNSCDVGMNIKVVKRLEKIYINAFHVPFYL